MSTSPDELFESLLTHVEPRPGIHGLEHWRRVLANGVAVATATEGADLAVVACFAALHDSLRLNDGRDPEHGLRASLLARRLHAEGELPLDGGQLELLCAALVDHDRGLVSEDPTVGACWDADRLDLTRLGYVVRKELLSTEAGPALVREP